MQLVIRKSPWRLVVMFLGSLAFVAIGLLMVFGNAAAKAVPGIDQKVPLPMVLWGWAGILFFGLCAVAILWFLIDPRPRLVFDEDGVFDRTLRVGKIPWSDIRHAYIASIHGVKIVCLEVHDETKYLARLSSAARMGAAANRALGFSSLCLNLSGLKIKPEDALRIVLTCKREKAGPAAQDPP